MDDEKYQRQRRAYHSARTSGALAGAITAFIAFCAFELAGFAIAETAVWMFALALMAASATFVAVYIGVTASLKKTGIRHPPEAPV